MNSARREKQKGKGAASDLGGHEVDEAVDGVDDGQGRRLTLGGLRHEAEPVHHGLDALLIVFDHLAEGYQKGWACEWGTNRAGERENQSLS